VPNSGCFGRPFDGLPNKALSQRGILVKVDIEKMNAGINLMKNATYFVKNGELKMVPTSPIVYG
jgi:hypothetical protein